jgi:hypothetical protein
MIEAKDIRIGINIFDEFENIIEVTIENFEDVFYDRGFFKPIPLTEPILLKLFKRLNAIYFYKRFSLVRNKAYNFFSVYENKNSLEPAFITKVEHLHELQNVIYSLDNEELKIKL